MRLKLIFIITLTLFSMRLYSQISVTTPSYDYFIDTFIKDTGMYADIPKETISNLTYNEQLKNLFDIGISSLGGRMGLLLGIINDPYSILETTTNEAIILLFGTTLGFLEAANMQIETSKLVIDSLKEKIAFNASSGNNNGLLIPMHTPIGSFGINIYVDTPIFDILKAKTYPVNEEEYYGSKYANEDINDYKAIADALKMIPIPHINGYFQINFGPIPLALTLRGGLALGLKELFGAFVNDVDIEAVGYNVGASLKGLLFRTKYFFGDLRADFNYEAGRIGLSVNNRKLYVPLRLGYGGGVDTGVVFNGNAFLQSKWKAFSISPKLVFGLKIKEEIPVIKYFSAYFSAGADIVYGDVQSTIGINGIGSYANIMGHTLEVNDLSIPQSQDRRKYWLYDMRVGFHIDIFYQSLSVEYGIFTKQFAFSFIPINIRF